MPEIAPELKNDLDQFRVDFERLRNEIGKVIVGQQAIVDGVLLALVAGGHVLLEGVPGLGKTMLVRTLASALEAKFSRIQFTGLDACGSRWHNDHGRGRRRQQEFPF